QRRGVAEHPHRGFETVTILWEGGVDHRDSGGASGSIGPGDVQWMTAGSGVVHEEFHSRTFAEQGGTFHGVQLWVNLPAKDKLTAPRYQDLRAAEIPIVSLPGGATARVIAGELAGEHGPGQTFTPINLWDVTLPAGARAELEVPADHATLVALLEGTATIADGGQADGPRLFVLNPGGERLTLAAQGDVRLLVMTGEPLGEPVAAHGPFVMNTREEIVQAVQDFQTGKLGRLS
ncbi:MAG: pirin family protein, partial [Planctomycetota bacterium]|nr:pirin family protein [Planctomycetota bacterium]